MVWRLYLWAKSPTDAAVRSMALCLLCAGLSYPVAMPGGASGVDTVAGHGSAKLIQNLLLLVTVYFLMCFYLFSAEEPTAHRRARGEAVVVGLVAVGLVVTAETVPHSQFAGSFSNADMSVPQLALFYGGAGLYLMYALAMGARWSRKYARLSRRPHATGLWMAAAGLGAMALACAVRAVIVAIRAGGQSVPGALMDGVAFVLVAAILLFAIGVSYSGAVSRLAAIRLWRRHRRDYERLAPLWSLLSTAHPENVLAPRRHESMHRRYRRRVVECRDGLSDMSPYLSVDPGTDLAQYTPSELARELRRAAGRVGSTTPAPRPAVPLAVGKGREHGDDVEQLIAVSDALRSDRTAQNQEPTC